MVMCDDCFRRKFVIDTTLANTSREEEYNEDVVGDE